MDLTYSQFEDLFCELSKPQEEINISSCHKCNVCGSMLKFDDALFRFFCDSCGIILEDMEKTYEEFSNNTPNNTYSCIVLRGTKAKEYGKQLSKVSPISNVDRYNEIRKLYISYITKSNITIPSLIIDFAVEKYLNISGEKILRMKRKKDVLAACLSFACQQYNPPFILKDRDIAILMELDKMGFAEGKKILKHSTTGDNHEEIVDKEPYFLERNFAKLNIINENYIKFAKKVLKICKKNHIGKNSLSSTRAGGVIWLLSIYESLNVTVNDMEKIIGIRKNTFVKFYKELINNLSLFDHLFTKYKINRKKPIIRSTKHRKKSSVTCQ